MIGCRHCDSPTSNYRVNKVLISTARILGSDNERRYQKLAQFKSKIRPFLFWIRIPLQSFSNEQL